MPTAHDDKARYRAVAERDPDADGRFVYAVKTTGVYCHPSCAARTPLEKNVLFFENAEAAVKAGYRECTKCGTHPKRLQAQVELACTILQKENLSLSELARRVKLSPFHFQRAFKSMVGVTPKVYAKNMEHQRMRKELASTRSVTEAIYAAGFSSSSRFYASANDLGMTPSLYKKGAPRIELQYAFGRSSLGQVLVSFSDRGICGIFLGDHRMQLLEELRREFPKASLKQVASNLGDELIKIIKAIESPSQSLELPLDIRGTAFQVKVWRALSSTKAGETLTYASLARRIGHPNAIRAVANACASNRIAVLIPCHRVVRTSGQISGYRWGVNRKALLIERERVSK